MKADTSCRFPNLNIKWVFKQLYKTVKFYRENSFVILKLLSLDQMHYKSLHKYYIIAYILCPAL